MQQSIPFTKTQASGNDFLIVDASAIPPGTDVSSLSRRICDRRHGIGADGLILFSSSTERVKRIRLLNSDGSRAEISGNGTCCVAAFVLRCSTMEGFTADTGAGLREVSVRAWDGTAGSFVLEMGVPVFGERCVEVPTTGSGMRTVSLVNVGNPQCVMFYDEEELPEDWREISRSLAADSDRFPDGVNVSFSRVLDRHTLKTAFYERGAGETPSSGTGAIGAAVLAIVRGFADSPVTIKTAEGSLKVVWKDTESSVELEGHAQVVGKGTFWLSLN